MNVLIDYLIVISKWTFERINESNKWNNWCYNHIYLNYYNYASFSTLLNEPIDRLKAWLKKCIDLIESIDHQKVLKSVKIF